jgi:hypothetical protein
MRGYTFRSCPGFAGECTDCLIPCNGSATRCTQMQISPRSWRVNERPSTTSTCQDSMTAHASYAALTGASPLNSTSTAYPSSRLPPSSRDSHDSDDSLRALEVSDGPRLGRGRNFSISGFDFRHDLLPLTASQSEPDSYGDGERSISLVNGRFSVDMSIISL